MHPITSFFFSAVFVFGLWIIWPIPYEIWTGAGFATLDFKIWITAYVALCVIGVVLFSFNFLKEMRNIFFPSGAKF